MKTKVRVSKAEFDELTRPKLKLFLSVDIVGSTELKHQGGNAKAQPWLSFFFAFFANFPTLFSEALAEQCQLGRVLEAKLWKSLGDELIFTAELKSRHDAGAYLRAFRLALLKAVENWKVTKDNSNLLLKGTAWIAGFPVGNAEIPLESSSTADTDGRDYIGPHVDAGFRLKEHSTPRKLIVSADLAYLLLGTENPGLDLFFDGDVSLKGVIRNKPYPIIWADCFAPGELSDLSIHHLKDKLLGRGKADLSQLRDYLKLWLADSQGHVPIPFIINDPFEDLQAPLDFERKREAVIAELQNHIFVQEDEESKGKDQLHAALVDYLK